MRRLLLLILLTMSGCANWTQADWDNFSKGFAGGYNAGYTATAPSATRSPSSEYCVEKTCCKRLISGGRMCYSTCDLYCRSGYLPTY